ncbi:MAG: PIG-L deacetylase family protein [Candidatus Limnocylindria bacterium]
MSSIWRPIRERNPARSLMVVVAHPGDEAFGFAGAIAQAVAAEAYVVVVCVTRGYFDWRLHEVPPAPGGSGGKNRDLDRPLIWRNLDTVREDELRRSVALLGVRVLRMLNYSEGELPSVRLDDLVGRIVEPIRMHRPEVILTFGPDGVTGDPDHAIVSEATTLAFETAGVPLAYEDDLEEDQVAWRAAKLYHLVVPRPVVDALGEEAPAEFGSEAEPTLTLELGDAVALKQAAIACHVSQVGQAGAFAGWDTATRDRYLAEEHYRLLRSNLSPAQATDGVGRMTALIPREEDLFAGLPD